jgi:rRNA maturation RNase YbeY
LLNSTTLALGHVLIFNLQYSIFNMIEVVNRQRKTSLDCEHWRAFTKRALKVVPAHDMGVTIAFVSDHAMKQLNRTWRGKQGTTDVLSFPAGQDEFEKIEGAMLGDIAISVDRAKAQAKQNGLSLEQEISQLILHGLLHLCGYDHETDNGEMNRLELRLRRKLCI